MPENLQSFGGGRDGSDGFTLTDFVSACFQHWKLSLGIVAVALALGVVSYKMRSLPPFVHSTTLEIGTRADGQLIETLPAVKAKLEDAYIPQVIAEDAKENNYKDERYRVDVSTPEQGSSVLLSSTAGESATPSLLALQQKIADRLVADHERLAGNIQQDLDQQKFTAELKLDDIRDQQRRIPSKRATVEAAADLVGRQIKTTQALVDSAEHDREAAILTATTKASVDESLATTLLLLDNTLAKHREEIRTLEERLYVKIPGDRATVDSEASALKRSEKEQEQAVSTIVFNIDHLRPTRILLPPSRLPRAPLGGGLYQTLTIFGGVGVILGLFSAAFAEIVREARRRTR